MSTIIYHDMYSPKSSLSSMQQHVLKSTL